MWEKSQKLPLAELKQRWEIRGAGRRMLGFISLGISPSTCRFLSQFVPRVCAQPRSLYASSLGSGLWEGGSRESCPLGEHPCHLAGTRSSLNSLSCDPRHRNLQTGATLRFVGARRTRKIFLSGRELISALHSEMKSKKRWIYCPILVLFLTEQKNPPPPTKKQVRHPLLGP